MGYSTDYYGEARIVPGISSEDEKIINEWLNQRHVICNPERIEREYGNLRTVDYAPLGEGAWNWVPSPQSLAPSYMFDNPDVSQFVVDHNEPPFDCPSLWSDLRIENGCLVWTGTEKTYAFVDWLIFIQRNILDSLGCRLEGQFDFQGEDKDDCGRFYVSGDQVTGDFPTR